MGTRTRGLGADYVASLRVFRSVFRNPDLRRVELAFIAFTVAEWATWVAIGVYAYSAGGPASVGVVSLLLLLPSAAVAPFAASIADRFCRERVLAGAYLLQAATAGGTAIALLMTAPRGIVYLLAVGATASQTLVRPAQGALLPAIAADPAELTAANVALVSTRNVGLLLGPVVASVLLAVGEPGTVYAVMAGVLAAAAALVARVHVHRPVAPPRRHAGALRRAAEGFRTVGRERAARVIVVLLTAKFFVQGALRVLLVIVAIEYLGLGDPGVGWLNAALGAGGAIGAAVTVLLIGRRRLSPAFAGGVLLWGVPLLLLGIRPGPALAVGALAVTGMGRTVMDVSGRTLLARIAPDDAIARVFGVLESLYMFALATGSVAAAVLADRLGTRAAIVAAGLFLPGVAVLSWSSLREVDRGPVVDRARLELILGVPLFSPLPPHAIERLAAHLELVVAAEGTALIRQGAEGDRFYVLDEGRAEAVVDGNPVAVYDRGGYFGEIALLRDIPRTATVRALTDVRAFALSREEFLAAVSDHPESLAVADSVIDLRMPAAARANDYSGAGTNPAGGCRSNGPS